jgi:O-antigen ligase
MQRVWDSALRWTGHILAFAFLLSFLLPVLTRSFGAKPSWVLFVLWVPIAIVVRWRMSRNAPNRPRAFSWVLGFLSIWTVVVSVNAAFAQQGSGWLPLIAAICTWMAAVMGAFQTSADQQTPRTMLIWLTLLLGVQAVVSLPVLYNEVGVAKDLMLVNPIKSPADYALRGVGDYHLYTALAVLSPALLGAIVTLPWKYAMVPGACFAAILSSVALSTFSGAAAVAVLGIIMFLGLKGWHQGGRKWLFIPAVVIGSFVLLGLVGAALTEVAQIEMVTSKLNRLFEGVANDGMVRGDSTGRGYFAMLSLNSFLQHPFFGVGMVTTSDRNDSLYVLVGGHCSWLDQLAEYGLVGFAPFLAFWALGFRNAVRRFRARPSAIDAGLVAMMASYSICGLVNPVIFVDSITVPVAFLVAGMAAKAAPNRSLAGVVGRAGRQSALPGSPVLSAERLPARASDVPGRVSA